MTEPEVVPGIVSCIRCQKLNTPHCKSKTCTWGRCKDCGLTVYPRRRRIVHDGGKIIAPGT